MKKAFTLIELLVVIAIIAILAAMLMPALSRAREEARKTQCRSNVHNVGIGFHLFLTDHDGIYPGWVDDDLKTEIQNDTAWQDGTSWSDHTELLRYATPTDGDPYYQLVTRGYLDTPGLFDCPTSQNMTARQWGGGPVVFVNSSVSRNIANFGQTKQVQFAEYGYDLGRVSRNSVAGRVFYGDLWEHDHIWGATQGHWDYNHRDGANVLQVDQAVEWAALQDEGVAGSSWTAYASSWNRVGWIPNPRMDEDVHRFKIYEEINLDIGTDPPITDVSQLMYPLDHDDVYVIEGRNHGGTVQPLRWCYIGDPTMRDGYGGSGEWSSNCHRYPEPGGGSIRRYRFWSANNSRRMYPEKGAYAEEPRWDTHDARIIPFGAYYTAGYQ